jgi:hypothetical protein
MYACMHVCMDVCTHTYTHTHKHTLQAWVCELFSEVPNKDVPSPEAEYAGKLSPTQPGSEAVSFGVGVLSG